MLWNIEFYETEGGRIPVLREPHSKRIVGINLNELRIQASPNIYRVFYFAYIHKRFILLHRKEIEIAMDRMGNYIRRDKND